MTTTTTKSLEQKIERAVEQLVREHLAACEAAAAMAVRAAFKRASTAVPKSSRRKSAPAPRRSRAELAGLEKRLYEAICSHPGETMAVLASSFKVRTSALSLPATKLRREGRVRSVGQRQHTRYFPMAE